MTDTPNQTILQGDCIDEMQAMDENSVHAVVTDPPYGLAFMPGVNEWDEFDSPKDYQDFCEEWADECRRVLKPGGHLIAFSGNRTYGRLMCGVQDAGFEIRDTLTWHQGEGFPKASDVSKHIDRYYDAEDEREVVGTYTEPDGTVRDNDTGWSSEGSHEGYVREAHEDYKRVETAPATSEAERWDGWKTCLKPSTEFAVLARAPMSEDAIYKNVLKHGTGALNIDRTRVPTSEEGGRPQRTHDGGCVFGAGHRTQVSRTADGTTTEGRYPANLLLDPIAAAMLDEQSGTSQSPESYERSVASGNVNVWGETIGDPEGAISENYGDEGGASRFFKTVGPTRFKYTSKACKSERTINGEVENNHSTVKPLELMEWLVTLVTAPGQRVLDPFAGSGTTIMACRRLNREGIGIEMDEGHAEIARERVALADEADTDFLDSRPTADDTDATEDTDGDGPATLESFGDDD